MKGASQSGKVYARWLITLATLALVGAALWSLNRWWLSLVLMPVILIGFHYRQALSANWRAALIGVMAAAILVFGLNSVQVMRSNVAHPPEWDFLSFWLDGRVAAQGLNFYDAQNYEKLAQPFNPSTEFTQEITTIGFRYPPPTMFFLVPLGWFDIRTSIALWYIAHSILLGLACILLWKTFLGQSGVLGLGLTAALILMSHATLSTITYAQTNFLALFLLALFWRDRERPRGGLWLAIGIFVKPFLAFLLLYLLLRRHWRVVASTLVVLIAASLLSMVAFGLATFLSYFTANPTAEMPGYVYTEMVNQSLLATILRLTGYDFSSTSPLTQPIFVALSLVLTAITGWLVARLDMRHSEWALALVVLLALLLYPATLESYSVLLIMPMLLLWKYQQEFVGGMWGVAAFITLVYAVVGFRSGNYVFFAIALNWLALAGISAWALRQQARQPGLSHAAASPS